jgi:hypothetical protein
MQDFMVVATLMLGVTFAMLVEGSLPAHVDKGLLRAYVLFLGSSLCFLFISLWFALQLQGRLSSWMAGCVGLVVPARHAPVFARALRVCVSHVHRHVDAPLPPFPFPSCQLPAPTNQQRPRERRQCPARLRAILRNAGATPSLRYLSVWMVASVLVSVVGGGGGG